jgi:hypothetical protein
MSLISFHIHHMRTCNDDISSEEHFENPKISKGSLITPKTIHFCQYCILKYEFYLVTKFL